MSDSNPQVDNYLAEGCGRCKLGGTPACKVHTWSEELNLLRSLVLDSGLNEELKWSQPCYTLNGKNILLVTAFKEYACIAFFKGSLLTDEQNLLVAPGENSQASRQLRFTSVDSITQNVNAIQRYIQNAIDIEKQGRKVEFSSTKELEYPEELELKMRADPEFKKAFEALTPGRQRGYLLHFTGAKQSDTRTARIEKYAEHILKGKGLHDR